MPEITKSYIHLPAHNRQKGDQLVTITVSKSKGIKALYSVNRKVIITLLFDREERFSWTMKRAKEWKYSHMSVIEATLVFAGADPKSFVYSDEPSEDYCHTVSFVTRFGHRIKF
ncbi:hypothetical protein LCGC14_2875310 [marine sediment metagenome]|uniref:Uncharacterized protein n=1 Tax=marine sediment metagenome TaxID=412755 RepID=A0A0F8Y1W0_9ZZZZ